MIAVPGRQTSYSTITLTNRIILTDSPWKSAHDQLDLSWMCWSGCRRSSWSSLEFSVAVLEYSTGVKWYYINHYNKQCLTIVTVSTTNLVIFFFFTSLTFSIASMKDVLRSSFWDVLQQKDNLFFPHFIFGLVHSHAAVCHCLHSCLMENASIMLPVHMYALQKVLSGPIHRSVE